MTDDTATLDALPNLEESQFKPIDEEALFAGPRSPHPPRILMLYGSLRERSYSRLATEEAARILRRLGAEVRIFNPSDLPLPDSVAADHPAGHRRGCRHGIEDRAILAHIGVQEIDPAIVLVGVDDYLVVYRGHPGRRVLAHAVQPNVDATKIELEQRCRAFDALDHAGRQRREQKLGRIEGVGTAVDVGVEINLRVLAACEAAMRIDASCIDMVFKHHRPSIHRCQAHTPTAVEP